MAIIFVCVCVFVYIYGIWVFVCASIDAYFYWCFYERWMFGSSAADNAAFWLHSRLNAPYALTHIHILILYNIRVYRVGTPLRQSNFHLALQLISFYVHIWFAHKVSPEKSWYAANMRSGRELDFGNSHHSVLEFKRAHGF